MAQNNNLSTLNGLFKEVYAAKLEQIIPDGVKLLKTIQFVSRERQNGSLYHQPVVLGLEHGMTYATSGDAFTLNNAIAGTIKDAQVQGTQLVLRSVLSYTAASRAVGGGAKAFEDSTKFLVSNMLRSMARKLEIELLYGQVGIGTVASVASNTMTITTAEWAPGIWAGAEGMPLDIRTGAAGSSRGTCSVVSVDMSARTVTVDAMPAMVAANDAVFISGSFGNEFAGIHKILTNTGVLFNIDASVYNLWKGNSVASTGTSGRLTFDDVNRAVARCVEKGQDGALVLHVNPRTWANLLSDQAALRKYDSGYKSAQFEQGAEALKFHSQNGTIEIMPNIYVKEGYAYLISTEDMIRVGSSDITFKRPGQGDEFFRDLETAAGYELRAFCDQALFCSAPGKLCVITGIVNV